MASLDTYCDFLKGNNDDGKGFLMLWIIFGVLSFIVLEIILVINPTFVISGVEKDEFTFSDFMVANILNIIYSIFLGIGLIMILYLIFYFIDILNIKVIVWILVICIIMFGLYHLKHLLYEVMMNNW